MISALLGPGGNCRNDFCHFGAGGGNCRNDFCHFGAGGDVCCPFLAGAEMAEMISAILEPGGNLKIFFAILGRGGIADGQSALLAFRKRKWQIATAHSIAKGTRTQLTTKQ